MSTSAYQDKQFISDVIGDRILEKVVDWVSSNLEPEDVFSEEKLAQWAKDWAPKNAIPPEIFPDAMLEEWAEENGWKKP